MNSISSVESQSATRTLTWEQPSAIQSAGRFCLYIFLFLSYSRITDVFPGIIPPAIRLPLVLSLLAFIAAVGSGGVQRALSSTVGKLLLGFTIWLLVGVPFSYWPGGSFALLTDQWFKSALVFGPIAGLLRTRAQCRVGLYAMAAGTVVIVAMSLTLGSTAVYGRLTLEQGTLSNPNDLAQLLLIGLPFVALVALLPSQGGFRRPVVYLCCFAVLLVTLVYGIAERPHRVGGARTCHFGQFVMAGSLPPRWYDCHPGPARGSAGFP